jgi:hypothetical protein
MKKPLLLRIVPATFVFVLFVLGLAAPSQAQRVEINPFFGYTASDGVTVDPILIDGEIYDAVNVKSGISYGFLFGVYATENVEVGFLWSRQDSTLEGEGTTTREFSSMPVSNYHGIVAYNFGDSGAAARPFIFGGLGATTYSPDDVNGQSIDSNSQFSSTWGAGIKVYGGGNVGVSVMGRWTPTYIKSDPGGIWCGYYGCYVLEDTQYANQFEISGGVSFRF